MTEEAAAVSRYREHAEVDAKDQDQHQTHPERRHREDHHEAHSHAMIDGLVALERRQDCQRHADQDRKQGRVDNQPQRHRQTLEDQRPDALLVVDRVAEVALEEMPHEQQVLRHHRPVKAQLVTQHLRSGSGVVDAENERDGVSRHQPEQEERDDRHSDHHHKRLQDPSEDETCSRGHRVSPDPFPRRPHRYLPGTRRTCHQRCPHRRRRAQRSRERSALGLSSATAPRRHR